MIAGVAHRRAYVRGNRVRGGGDIDELSYVRPFRLRGQPADTENVALAHHSPETPTYVGRSWWLTYSVTTLFLASAVGLVLGIAGAMSVAFGSVYVVCVLWVAYDFLYVSAFQLRSDKSICQVQCLLRSYAFRTQSISSISLCRSGPFLFGMRRYRIRYTDPTGKQGRCTVVAWHDPSADLSVLAGITEC